MLLLCRSERCRHVFGSLCVYVFPPSCVCLPVRTTPATWGKGSRVCVAPFERMRTSHHHTCVESAAGHVSTMMLCGRVNVVSCCRVRLPVCSYCCLLLCGVAAAALPTALDVSDFVC